MLGLDYQPCAACAFWFGDRIMLTQRKTKVFNGCMGVVGGKIDAGEMVLDGLLREVREETGYTPVSTPRLLDCYLAEEYKHKVFLFDCLEPLVSFDLVRNLEPEKHTDWELFAREQALRMNLVPFLRHYLTNPLTLPEIPVRLGV